MDDKNAPFCHWALDGDSDERRGEEMPTISFDMRKILVGICHLSVMVPTSPPPPMNLLGGLMGHPFTPASLWNLVLQDA